MDELSTIKQDLKCWEHMFQRKHGRKPNKVSQTLLQYIFGENLHLTNIMLFIILYILDNIHIKIKQKC